MLLSTISDSYTSGPKTVYTTTQNIVVNIVKP